jgi:hypothetical protein
MKARVSAGKVESGHPSKGSNRRFKRTHYFSPRRNMNFSIPTHSASNSDAPGVKLTRAFDIGEIVVLCY